MIIMVTCDAQLVAPRLSSAPERRIAAVTTCSKWRRPLTFRAMLRVGRRRKVDATAGGRRRGRNRCPGGCASWRWADGGSLPRADCLDAAQEGPRGPRWWRLLDLPHPGSDIRAAD